MYTTFVSCMLTETSVDSIDLMKNDQNHVAGAGRGGVLNLGYSVIIFNFGSIKDSLEIIKYIIKI